MPFAFQGLLFAAIMSGWSMISDHAGWRETLFSAVVIGPLYGLAMWYVSRDARRDEAATVGGMSREQRRAVMRAAKTGKPPADSALRTSAALLVRGQLLRHQRSRTFTLTVFALFTAMSVVGWFASGWWYGLAGTVLFGGALIWAGRYRGQLQRKLAALEAPPSSAPSPKTRV